MKKILSICLAVLLLASSVPTAYAAEVHGNWGAGTEVVYEAANNETYTVTVPAQLAPGGNGEVTLEGTWPSDRVVSVTADLRVVLNNSIKTTERKSLKVTFPGIAEYGSNTESQTFTETVSVADITGALFGTWTGTFSYNVDVYDGVDRLQSEHEFAYYTTINEAVADVNAGTPGVNPNSNKASAGAGVYTENGNTYVVLLKDTALTESVQPTKDMTINLGGYTLSATDMAAIDTGSGSRNNLTIDGRLPGSTISVMQTISSTSAVPVMFRSIGYDFALKGGTYILDGVNSNAACVVVQTGEANIKDAKFIATDIGVVRAINLYRGVTSSSVKNCECIVSSQDKTATGIQASNTATIEGCYITVTGANSVYGIRYSGDTEYTATVEDCHIIATSQNVIVGENQYASGVQIENATATVEVHNSDIFVTAAAATIPTAGVYAKEGTATVTDSGITVSGGSQA